MEEDAAVFRTGETLAKGVERLAAAIRSAPTCASPTAP